MDIKNHYEVMDHEFSSVKVSLSQFGYKLDGESGVKVVCQLSVLKSADYIYEKPGKVAYVEFSDLPRSYKSIRMDNEKIKNAGKDGYVCKKIVRDYYLKAIDSVTREAVEKFKDTILIVMEVDKFYKNIPKSFSSAPAVILVVPPIDEYFDSDKVEIARLLDRLKNALTVKLPGRFFSSIHVVDVIEFHKSY